MALSHGTAKVAEFVDVDNPALGIDCPRCGLWTARFGWFCRNCSFRLWPDNQAAARAYRRWRLHDPSRSRMHQWEDTPAEAADVLVVDFKARAHDLGVHVSPPSHWPIIISVGIFFLCLAAIDFGPTARIALVVLGAIGLVMGIAGWMLEDVRLFPRDTPGGGHGHGGGH